jgi:hypothetical protein
MDYLNGDNQKRAVWGLVLLGVVACLFAGLLYFYYHAPHGGLGPVQPIYFSHRVHAGVKEIGCRFCHPYVERSRNAGIPPVSLCFHCHDHIIPLHPEIVRERQYLETRTPVPWVRVFYLPDHVKFNHRPHVRAGLGCENCHGEVRKMDRLVGREFEMGFCIACHGQTGAQLDCWLACHN